MKKTIIIISLLFLSVISYGQNNYKKGFYLNLIDLPTDSPSLNPEIEIEKRSKSKLKMVGGRVKQCLNYI